MGRLTKKETAAEIRENAEKLRAIGLEPSIIDLRYLKLAAYEDEDERRALLGSVCNYDPDDYFE